MSLIKYSIACAALFVAGCQTTGSLSTPEAELAKAVTATYCIIESSNNIDKEKIRPENIYVYSITDRPNGWKAADVSTPGLHGRVVRGNVYFHTITGEFACGTKNWRKYQSDPTKNRLPKSDIVMGKAKHE
ncbi:MAG: hypothetical protein OQK24_01800 [Magnetovibrio sp.]|nr:hypothetical protein [Magnetovibrio sp.]